MTYIHQTLSAIQPVNPDLIQNEKNTNRIWKKITKRIIISNYSQTNYPDYPDSANTQCQAQIS